MSDAPPWDRSLAYQMTRARYIHYMDEVERLMRQESKLLPLAGDDLREQIIQLAQRIQIVERNGGDAAALRADKAAIIGKRDEHEPELAKVQQQLASARECLKWSDMASEGMHWLCFAEPRYEELRPDPPSPSHPRDGD